MVEEAADGSRRRTGPGHLPPPAGDQERYHEPAGALYPLGRHRWWRPLGCRSALRKAGILATVAALRAALGSETAIPDEHRSQRA